uniref:Uncharacterized protein n=1 Tax=Trichuris muris TaxID=70415 RepID=A0A5S6QFZ3_TRIMR
MRKTVYYLERLRGHEHYEKVKDLLNSISAIQASLMGVLLFIRPLPDLHIFSIFKLIRILFPSSGKLRRHPTLYWLTNVLLSAYCHRQYEQNERSYKGTDYVHVSQRQ